MKVSHRGLDIALDDTDSRVRVIETLLWGGPLPPPLSPPVLTDLAPPPPPPQVSPEMRRVWNRLPLLGKRELVFLFRNGPCKGVTLEKAMGVGPKALLGCHSSMSRIARNSQIWLWVQSKGRWRTNRIYSLTERAAAAVKQIVDAGLDKDLPPPKL